MTIWQPDIADRTGPRYIAIADALGDDILTGALTAGDKLPTHRDLAWRLGVTVGTVSRAYAEAERRGLVVGEVGRGTFVREGVDSEYDPGFAIRNEEETGCIEMGLNFPALCGSDVLLADALRELPEKADLTTLIQYQPDVGMMEHRIAGARWARSAGLDAKPENIVVCAGVQHAVSVLCTILARPGDLVLTEAHTYPGIMVAAQHLHLRIQGLPMDGEGILPDAVDEACRHGGARLLYVTPTLHNPTTAVMSEQRRRDLAEVARRHQLFILEDDVYSFLATDCPPPLTCFAPERTFYMCSASKALAPGLRVGFIHIPQGFAAQVGTGVRMSVWMVPPLMAEIASRWIMDGTADMMKRRHIEEVKARQAMARRILDAEIIGASHPAAYHIWLNLPEPWRADEFAAHARARNTHVIAAETFAASRVHSPHAIRLCLGGVRTRDRLETGLQIIADALEERPKMRMAVI